MPSTNPARWSPLRRRLSRRSLLAASARAGVGAAGLALVGCGEEEEPQPLPEVEAEPQQAQQTQQAQSFQAGEPAQSAQQQQQVVEQAQATQQEVAEGEAAEPLDPAVPRRGGIVQVWQAVAVHDRWDPHRSRFRYTQAMHSLMYSRLLQPARVSTGELAADLCALPEMPDETTYVFTVQPRAVFWDRAPTDGRAVTAEDLRWNIERQQAALDAEGEEDVLFFRRSAYQRTASAAAQAADGVETLTLTTAEPDAAYLASVHAGPFAWITSPEAAEEYGDVWRDDPQDVLQNSGTGPYTPRTYESSRLTLARSENWWQADSAWPDGIILRSAAEETLMSEYQDTLLDRVDFPLSNDTVTTLRQIYPHHEPYEVPMAAAVELLTPQAADAEHLLSDPRVTRAVALGIDRARLLERLYGEHGRRSGPLPWYLDGWSLSEEQLAAFAGYRADRDADLAEIAQLLAAAGLGDGVELPLVVADLFEAAHAGTGQAVQEMLAGATGLDVDLEFRPLADAIGQLRDGERFCFLTWGAVPTQADPTDAWRAELHGDGERRWSAGADAEGDALIEEMGRTFDLAARQALAQQVQERLLSGEAPQWRVKLGNGIQLGIQRPYFYADTRLADFAWSTQYLSGSWLHFEHEEYPAGERDLPPEPEPEPESEQSAEQADSE